RRCVRRVGYRLSGGRVRLHKRARGDYSFAAGLHERVEQIDRSLQIAVKRREEMLQVGRTPNMAREVKNEVRPQCANEVVYGSRIGEVHAPMTQCRARAALAPAHRVHRNTTCGELHAECAAYEAGTAGYKGRRSAQGAIF